METENTNIFYLKKKIIFPYCEINILIRESDSIKKIKKGDRVLAFPVKSILDIIFHKNRLATLSEVVNITGAESSIKFSLKGLFRTKIKKIDHYKYAEYEIISDTSDVMKDLSDNLRKKTQELIFVINIHESDKLINLLNYIVNINQLTDFITNYFVLNFRERYSLYRELNIEKRGKNLLKIINRIIKELTLKKSSS